MIFFRRKLRKIILNTIFTPMTSGESLTAHGDWEATAVRISCFSQTAILCFWVLWAVSRKWLDCLWAYCWVKETGECKREMLATFLYYLVVIVISWLKCLMNISVFIFIAVNDWNILDFLRIFFINFSWNYPQVSQNNSFQLNQLDWQKLWYSKICWIINYKPVSSIMLLTINTCNSGSAQWVLAHHENKWGLWALWDVPCCVGSASSCLRHRPAQCGSFQKQRKNPGMFVPERRCYAKHVI